VALAILSESGVVATGHVVEGGPIDAAKAAATVTDGDEGDGPYAVMIATYPLDRSRWLRQDVVDRVRKTVGLPVTHVVVTPTEARTPATGKGIRHVVVLSKDAIGTDHLLSALRGRAEAEPVRFTIIAPLDLPPPSWSDEAAERRRAAIAKVQRTVDALQAEGFGATGEVVDGGAGRALTEVVRTDRPDEVLLFTYRPDGDQSALERARKAAGSIPVEPFVLDAEAPAAPSGS
jgi:hypothetical protein